MSVTCRSISLCLILFAWCSCLGQESVVDRVHDLQFQAMETGSASWGYWGANPQTYAGFQQHSNRLIPVYTFGVTLDGFKDQASIYRDSAKIEKLFRKVPNGTLNESADYFDQTQLYQLQAQAVANGKKYVILFIFDGLDWVNTMAAATVRLNRVAYSEGRGTGLHFLDYKTDVMDYGFMVTSPLTDRCNLDVDSQTCSRDDERCGGYAAKFGGATPWAKPSVSNYLMGTYRQQPDVVTDSAASATSMCSGIKTYNAAINVDVDGHQVETLARTLQANRAFAVGVITSVPISHATPACAYANNVTRNDYQDLRAIWWGGLRYHIAKRRCLASTFSWGRVGAKKRNKRTAKGKTMLLETVI